MFHIKSFHDAHGFRRRYQNNVAFILVAKAVRKCQDIDRFTKVRIGQAKGYCSAQITVDNYIFICSVAKTADGVYNRCARSEIYVKGFAGKHAAAICT